MNPCMHFKAICDQMSLHISSRQMAFSMWYISCIQMWSGIQAHICLKYTQGFTKEKSHFPASNVAKGLKAVLKIPWTNFCQKYHWNPWPRQFSQTNEEFSTSLSKFSVWEWSSFCLWQDFMFGFPIGGLGKFPRPREGKLGIFGKPLLKI